MKNSIAWIVMSFFVATSCSEREKAANEGMDSTDLASSNKQLAKAPDDTQTDLYSDGKAKLIKTAHYRFEVENLKKSTEAIELAIKKFPAYISSSSSHLDHPFLENKITLRVQSEYFQDLLKEIDLQAIYVNFRDVESQDVSKEFVDLDSRIKTKREVEERFKDILRNKTGTVKDLLEAEREIGSIHEEIEAAIGKLNYMKDQVRYSNINLELYQTLDNNSIVETEEHLPGKFADAFLAGLKGLTNFTIAVVYLWPVVVLIALAFLYFRIKKKRAIRTNPA